jgi:hypothetical protein
MINPAKYQLTVRDPETYVALAVEDLLSTAGSTALHTGGEFSKEYLAMLSLYAIRRASKFFTEGMPYYKQIKLACDSFDPDHMSNKLIRFLEDLLSSVNESEKKESDEAFKELQLSAAAQTSLVSIGICSVSELLKLNRIELAMIRNLGDCITDEIAAALYHEGYKSKAVDLAFPGSSVKDIEKAKNDPSSVLSLKLRDWLPHRLYRNGIRSLSQVKNMSIEDLAELKGISYNDILEILSAIDEQS